MQKRQVKVGEEEMICSDNRFNISGVEIKRQYYVDVAIYQEQKFIGDLTSIPSVLIDYLNSSELKVFARIFRQIKTSDMCIIKRSSMALELGVSPVTITSTMNSLESMGFITQCYEGRRKYKKINFDAIQYLNDLLKDRLPGAAHAFRKAMEDRDVRKPRETALAILDLKYTLKEGAEAEEYN